MEESRGEPSSPGRSCARPRWPSSSSPKGRLISSSGSALLNFSGVAILSYAGVIAASKANYNRGTQNALPFASFIEIMRTEGVVVVARTMPFLRLCYSSQTVERPSCVWAATYYGLSWKRCVLPCLLSYGDPPCANLTLRVTNSISSLVIVSRLGQKWRKRCLIFAGAFWARRKNKPQSFISKRLRLTRAFHL